MEIENRFEVVYGSNDFPELYMPYDLHANSVLCTAIISPGCTGFQKIARVTTAYR
jgi:hypothetical protein